MTEIIYDPNREKLEDLASDIIEKKLLEIIAEKGKAIFAVPGGRSVSGIFKKLLDKEIHWNKVHIFMVDERLVTIKSKDSNFKLAKDNFIGNLLKSRKLKEENVHPFLLRDEPDFGLKIYEDELNSLGGKYDVVLLSSGEDGHIGALYPNHHSIRDESNYFVFMIDSPKPPPNRMSMSKKLLLRTQLAVLLFFGEAKKEALEKFKDDNIDTTDCPAKLVNNLKEAFAFTNIGE